MNRVLNSLLVGQERIFMVRNRCKWAKLGLTKGVNTPKTGEKRVKYSKQVEGENIQYV